MNGEAFVPRSDSKAVFAFAMACYAWTLHTLINAIIRSFHPIITPPNPYPEALYWFTVVLDSLLIASIIELLRRFSTHPTLHATVAGALLCATRSYTAPLWGVAVAPIYFISAFSYVRWRRTSWSAALITVIIINALFNVIPVIRTLFQHGRNA